jgi:hypothetical protein
VALGNGDGTFRQPQPLRFQDTPTSVTVGDLNGDDIPDLVVTTGHFGSRISVFVLRGNGDGTFQAPVGYAVGGPNFAAVIGDFDGDGIPDLAVENGDTVNVLRGNGDGTFGTSTSYLVGPVANVSGSMVAGDVNGDGAPDLAMANSFTGEVTVMLNRNDGTAPGRRAAATAPHPAAGRAQLAQLDATLDKAVAQMSPVTLRLTTTTLPPSAPAREQEVVSADAYFAALTGEDHAAVFPRHRPENRIVVKGVHPAENQNEELAALAAPTEA